MQKFFAILNCILALTTVGCHVQTTQPETQKDNVVNQNMTSQQVTNPTQQTPPVITHEKNQGVVSQDLPLKDVAEKMTNDTTALHHFLYLGKLHCLDSRYNDYPNDVYRTGMFSQKHAVMFNDMSNIARLLRQDKLSMTFTNFEKANTTKQQALDDVILICNDLYQSEKGKQLYLNFINNPDNYVDGNPKNFHQDYNMWEYEEVKQNLLDYLQYGQIDMRRMLDNCKTYDCKKE